ncbi:MAG: hypothetical protein WC979_09205 [Candidatus Pacearchaeota archaeon]|jgi:hypothetical protein
MRIGFDVDGVIANFTKVFTGILNGINPKCPILNDYSEVLHWYYDKFLPVTKLEIKRAWEIVDKNPNFWRSIPPIKNIKVVVDFVNHNRHQHDFYFITSRLATGGISATYQTINWLRAMGFRDPQVIETSTKGNIIEFLGIRYYIDDRTKNCLDVAEKSPGCKIYCPNYPYNADVVNSVIKVPSVIEYIEQVKWGMDK